MSRQSNTLDVGFPDLLVDLSEAPRRALRQTFEHAVREQIQSGRLRPGEPLPPSRTLAGQLGVSRSVVVQAYANLAGDGYLETRQGSGTRVRADPGDAAPAVTGSPDDPSAFFGPDRSAPLVEARAMVRLLGGTPDPALFPRADWARHYRAALAALPDRDLLYPPVRGSEALRTAMGAYLSRVRGVAHATERLIVCAGITQGITLTSRALRRLGARRVAVEEPCFGVHRTAIAMAGLEPVRVPVDDAGLNVAELARHDVDAMLVAPAYSFPTGSTLEPGRREALVKWARQRDAMLIEDDYDAELRYDRSPIGALQGMAPERVVCIGSVSKTLAPRAANRLARSARRAGGCDRTREAR